MVEPTADVSKLKSKNQVTLAQQTVVEPTADVSKVKAKVNMPVLAQPSVVEPPLSPDQLKLKRGEINMAQMTPQVEGPKLPVPAQRAAGVGDSAGTDAAGRDVPAQPSIQGTAVSKGQGQIIALGLSPADVRGPIEVPSGNRVAGFMRRPVEPDAPGTPNVAGTRARRMAEPVAAGQWPGNGSGSGNAPGGISVGAAPPGAASAAVVGTPGNRRAMRRKEANRKLIAAAMNPSVPSVSRPPVAPPPLQRWTTKKARWSGRCSAARSITRWC